MTPRIAFRALLLAAALAPAPALAQSPTPAIAAAVADASRPPADKARDANRKPAEVVAFAGLKPGDKVGELMPGGGYFTRVFAKVVGPAGKVYATVPAAMAQTRPQVLDGLNAIAKDSPNVVPSPIDFAQMQYPEPLDMVWTSENYHDFHNAPNADLVGLNKRIFAALKPGGVYMVEDHSAPGTGTGATQTLHRIDPAVVIKEAEAAGFVLEAQSEVLRNPEDPHTAGVRDPSIQGKTDKFLLKFRKPGQ